jgi:hypothetical protein
LVGLSNLKSDLYLYFYFRPLPIYYAEELPEHTELNGIYRSVPAMPTGMEKEEESEKHLQDILVKVKILPFINLVSSSFYVYDNNMKH